MLAGVRKAAMAAPRAGRGGRVPGNLPACDSDHSRPLRNILKSPLVRGPNGYLAPPSQKEKTIIEATSRLEKVRTGRTADRAMTRIIKISLLTALLGATALPVHGYFQSHSFFHPDTKYRDWF